MGQKGVRYQIITWGKTKGLFEIVPHGTIQLKEDWDKLWECDRYCFRRQNRTRIQHFPNIQTITCKNEWISLILYHKVLTMKGRLELIFEGCISNCLEIRAQRRPLLLVKVMSCAKHLITISKFRAVSSLNGVSILFKINIFVLFRQLFCFYSGSIRWKLKRF